MGDDQSGDEELRDLLDRVRASEELYARTFMANPVAMSITNAETDRFTHINVAFAQLVGYSRSDLIGRTSEEVGLWPDRTRRAEVGRHLADGEERPLVRAFIRVKSGMDVAVLVSYRMLELQNGRGVLSVLVPLPG